MQICKIYVVRHGESKHNRANLISGHVDSELTELGKQQVRATKQLLSDIEFNDVYSSDLKRAIDTAAIIYGRPVPNAHQLQALRERNYGQFEGRPAQAWEDLRLEKLAAHDALTEEKQWHFKHSESAESLFEVSERFVGALAHIAQANPGKTILIGAHGATLRTMLIKLGYATPAQLPSRSIDNAAYVELDYADGVFTVGTAAGINKA